MPDESRKILFILDEAAHLGHSQALEDAVTISRGMGIRLLFVFQSFSQMQLCYESKAATILDNLDTQIFFGTNSYETATVISKRIGDATIAIRTHNRSRSRSWATGNAPQPQHGNISVSDSINTSEIARRLIKEEEVMTLPDDVALIFHRNLPVIPAKLLKYYDAPEFKKGRRGVQRGLGLTGLLMSLSVLAVAVAFGLAAIQLPGPLRRPEPPAYPWPAMPPTARPQPMPAGKSPSRWHFDVVPERRYRPRPQLPPTGYGW